MAVTPISSYNTTRITGLISGMDTDSIITNMMKTEQAKIDRLFQQSTKLQWKKDGYTGVNTQLSAFRSKFMSLTSADNVFAASAYKTYKVNMDANKYVDIKAGSNASVTKHNITSIKMATAAEAVGSKHRTDVVYKVGTANTNSFISTSGSALEAGTDGSTKLSELKYADGTSVFTFGAAGDGSDDNLAFSINGKAFVFDPGQTLDEMMEKINTTTSAHAKMSLDNGVISIKSANGFGLNLRNVTDNANEVFGRGKAFSITDGALGVQNKIASGSMTLSEIQDATGKNLGFNPDGTLSFSINNKTFTFSETTTLDEMMDTINSDPDAKVTLSYDYANDAFKLKGSDAGNIEVDTLSSNMFGAGDSLFGIETGTLKKSETINRNSDTLATAATKMGLDLQLDPEGKFSFRINNVDFSFDKSTTLQKMMDTVNNSSEAKVKMSYSQITDSFVISSTETGSETKIQLGNKDGSNAFGGDTSFFGMATGTVTGTDAELMIDGEKVVKSTNSFTLDGIEFNLKSNYTAGVDEEINFSISQDLDTPVGKVKKFVEEYNTLVKAFNTLINEDVDYDYSPLTEAQTGDMSESQITKWETEAKKGLLRNDPTIKNLLSEMRNSLYEKVADTGLSPSDIGLSTGNWFNYGEITFDEDKFRAALQKDPDAVAKVMSNVSKSDDPATVKKENGLVTRFFDLMTATEKSIKDKSIAETTKAIDKNKDSRTELMEKMYEKQERYYQQFAVMEQLLAKYQSQSQWLTQQLGGAS